MKARTSVVSRLGLIALFAVVLFSSGRALAQENNPMAAAGLGIGLIMVFLIIGAAAYVYMSLALQTIADKTKTENSWLAWIPIANLVLMLNIAKKPMWWLILFPGLAIFLTVLAYNLIGEGLQEATDPRLRQAAH